MVDFVNRNPIATRFVNESAIASLFRRFALGTGGFDFSRNGDQFGIDSGGNLVRSTQDVSAHIFGVGILLEDVRSNLCLESEDQTDAAWVKTSTTTTGNTGTGADGATTADRIEYVGSLGAPQARGNDQTVTIGGGTASKTFTVSMFARAKSGTSKIRLKNTHGGVADNLSSDITLTTALTRHTFTVTNSAAAGSGAQIIGVKAATDDSAFDIEVWGFQLEEAAFASSYVPTLGATASRSTTDMRRLWPFPANGISEQIIDRPQFDATDDKGSDLQIINLSDGTENNYLRAAFAQGDDRIHLKKRVSAGTEVVVSTPVSALNYVKGDRLSIRFVADGNGLDMWVNALAKVSIATGDAPTDWTTKLTTIELPPSFHTVESSRLWNQANADVFMGNLT
jgi:hypothetical protein